MFYENKYLFEKRMGNYKEVRMSLFARQVNKVIDCLLPTPGEEIPEVRDSLISVQLLI